jgi:hypothetical protein
VPASFLVDRHPLLPNETRNTLGAIHTGAISKMANLTLAVFQASEFDFVCFVCFVVFFFVAD